MWLMYLFPIVGSTGGLLFMLVNPRPLYVAGGILFAIASVAMGVALFFGLRAGQRRKIAEDREQYFAYLDRIRQELREVGRQQQIAEAWRHPQPGQLLDVVRSPARIWERRPTDEDFLDVRIGTGSQPLATHPRLDVADNPLQRLDPVSLEAARRLTDRQRILPDLPVSLPLARTGITSILGDRQAVRSLARSLACQLAALHAPQDVRIALCARPEAAEAWTWIKWLPHCLHPDVFDGPSRARLTVSNVAELNEALAAEIANRQAQAIQRSRVDASSAPKPHLIIIIDADGLDPIEQFATGDSNVPLSALGVSVLYLVGSKSAEPSRVDVRVYARSDGHLDVEPVRAEVAAVRDGRADAMSVAECVAVARAMAPLRLSPSGTRSVVDTVELTHLLGLDDVAELRPEELWAPRPEREFLRVTFGVDSEGMPVVLDLKESALAGMGPHGLIIGATGSGKSELLRTLVTMLAVKHPPEKLAFVLIDYKGGATFAGLSELPHVAGLITNLQDDSALVDRMYAALFGEQRRRQEILKRVGNLDSVRVYNQRRDAGEPLEPLPTLLVIIDEFSELLTSRPEFIDLFMAIGRIGRSIGIHLMFASQRLEEGRLRGLESHLSYRICLRTLSSMESRVVLETADAYELPSIPGSGYLKVDTSVYQRFRSALVTAPYRPPTPTEVSRRAAITPYTAYNGVTALTAGVPLQREGTDASSPNTPTILDVVVSKLRPASSRVHQVWLPPLEPLIPLGILLPELVEDSGRGLVALGCHGVGRLAAPIGILDRPEDQRRDVFFLDFAGIHGHLVVVGAPQTGKSTLLRTLILSMCLTHAPSEIAFYCIDFGGGGLQALKQAPHVGVVSGRQDREQVLRTIGEVAGLLNEREQLFRGRGIDSPQMMRRLRVEGKLPEEQLGDVFLVIDNWPAVRAEFEREDLDPVIADIAARGLGYGIHLVLTATRWMEIRQAIRDNISGRLELRLNDPMDSYVDRRVAEKVPTDVPGRGLTPDKLYFQAALPRLDGRLDGAELTPAVEDAAERLAKAWHGPPVPRIRVLPPRVELSELPAPGGDPEPGVPIGVGEINLGPVYLDLVGAEPHFLVFGDSGSGKTTFLRAYLTGLVARTTPEQTQIIVVDYRRGLLEAVPEEFLAGYAGAAPAAAGSAREIHEFISTRLPGTDVTAEQLRNRSWWSGPELYVVVDDYDLVVAPSGNPLEPLVEFVAQGRDLGLHLLVARRSGGAGRALYEPLLQRLNELSTPGLLLSGDRQEGVLLGGQYAAAQIPGRGILVRRREGAMLIQIPCMP